MLPWTQDGVKLLHSLYFFPLLHPHTVNPNAPADGYFYLLALRDHNAGPSNSTIEIWWENGGCSQSYSSLPLSHIFNTRHLLNLTYSCDKFRQPENALPGSDCSLLKDRSLQEKHNRVTNQLRDISSPGSILIPCHIVGWVCFCCRLPTMVFLRVSRFSFLHKNQHCPHFNLNRIMKIFVSINHVRPGVEITFHSTARSSYSYSYPCGIGS